MACDDCPIKLRCRFIALNDGIPDGIFGGYDRSDREAVWKTWEEGKPTRFLEVIDDAVRPMLQERRDREASGDAGAFPFGRKTSAA